MRAVLECTMPAMNEECKRQLRDMWRNPKRSTARAASESAGKREHGRDLGQPQDLGIGRPRSPQSNRRLITSRHSQPFLLMWLRCARCSDAIWAKFKPRQIRDHFPARRVVPCNPWTLVRSPSDSELIQVTDAEKVSSTTVRRNDELQRWMRHCGMKAESRGSYAPGELEAGRGSACAVLGKITYKALEGGRSGCVHSCGVRCLPISGSIDAIGAIGATLWCMEMQ